MPDNVYLAEPVIYADLPGEHVPDPVLVAVICIDIYEVWVRINRPGFSHHFGYLGAILRFLGFPSIAYCEMVVR
jgi:hypothetical protein